MNRRDFLTASVTSFVAALGTHSLTAFSQDVYRSTKNYAAWSSDNVFLQGINAPVFQEVDIAQLRVTGEIPPDLRGMYLRNGPNPMFRPNLYAYPLEGDGMLHAVYFEEGKVRYRNRWILTKGLIYEKQAGKVLQEMRFHNYANTSIINHAGKLLALYETGLPYHITPDLETVGEWDFDGGIEQAMTAHPRFDPQTGELHFYRYSFFTEPYLTYYVANSAGKIIRTLPIALPRPGLLHDMTMTENYVIFFHCPLVLDVQRAMQCGIPFVWQPQYATRIGLIHRHNLQQEPIWIETEPLWVWHFMNAVEENDQIKIDYAYYPKIKLEPTLKAILENRSNFQRLTVDLKTKTVKHQPLDDRVVDFPTIDWMQTGKPYRFGYMPHIDQTLLAQKGLPNYFPELIQYDVQQQTSKVHRFKPGFYVGEATVVPKSNATTDTDSYVLAWVFDEARNASDLVILDAGQFEQDAIAQIHLPVRVPMGLHGRWFEG